MVAGVEHCASGPSGISGIELVIEDVGSQRSLHKWTVCGVPPSELYLIAFFVSVIFLPS